MTTAVLLPLQFPTHRPDHTPASLASSSPVWPAFAEQSHAYPERGFSTSSAMAAQRERFGTFLVLTDRESASGSNVHPNVITLLEQFKRFVAIYQLCIPKRNRVTSPFTSPHGRWSRPIELCNQHNITQATIFATGPTLADASIDLAYAYPAFVERIVAILPSDEAFHQQIRVKHGNGALLSRGYKRLRSVYLCLPTPIGAEQGRLCPLYVPEVDVTAVDDVGPAINQLALFLADTIPHTWSGSDSAVTNAPSHAMPGTCGDTSPARPTPHAHRGYTQ